MRPGERAGAWRMTWRIENRGTRTLEILAARLPHGRFKGERRFARAMRFAPLAAATFELPVTCREKPGSVVENAFVILRARWGGRPWRILARVRVAIDGRGIPEPIVELVTSHPVGFSGRAKTEGEGADS